LSEKSRRPKKTLCWFHLGKPHSVPGKTGQLLWARLKVKGLLKWEDYPSLQDGN
jgi:hypothetical protein